MAKILVVDDKEDVGDLMARVLREAGHAVSVQMRVEDGIRALQFATGKGKPFEICLIDMRFDNFEDATKQETAGMFVLDEALKVRFLEPIILTAFGSTEIASLALAKGVFRYVSKTSEAAKALAIDKNFLDQVVEMVSLAEGNREVFRTLDETLRSLEELSDEVVPIDGENFNPGRMATLLALVPIYLDSARKATDLILKARGRHPG